MTKDEIEKLAVEAGWPLFAIQMLAGTEDEKRLQRFAELVAAAERRAMVKEAAKKCWAMRNEDPFEDAVREIAAIRARGNA